MTNRMDYMHLTYGEWYQQIEKPRLEAIPESVRISNLDSHRIGVVDDCYRCTRCEIAEWNAWQKPCI